MSSKLLKQQLASLVHSSDEQSTKKTGEKVQERAIKKQVAKEKKKRAAAAKSLAENDPQRLLRQNIKYFTTTKKFDEAASSLMQKLIAGLSQQTDGQVNFVAVAPQATTPASTTISISSSTDSISNPKKKHGPAWRPPKTPSPPPVTPSGAAAGAGAAAASSTSTTGGALAEERMKRVGLVFQFPERHFLGETIFDELTFGWPIGPEHFMERQAKAVRIQKVLESVGLGALSMTMAPTSLSGGQQRRLALAIQLIRQPSVLLLDEPLAGLDWQARAEVASLLKELKKQCALLVVSHDLRELAPLVDNAWEMKEGGTMKSVAWPPPSADNGFMSMSSSIGE
eukprot:gene26827-4422_t